MNEVNERIEAMYDALGMVDIHYRAVLMAIPDEDKHCWVPVQNGIKYLKEQIRGAGKRITQAKQGKLL